MFITLNRYIHLFCKDLKTLFAQIDVCLEKNDHLNAKRLRIKAVRLLVKIDEYERMTSENCRTLKNSSSVSVFSRK